ncbi:NonSMC condensin I complex_ subunit G putorius, partial [Caligus rogercresseyi]
MAIGKLHLEMNELRDELDRFIEERDFVKAQEIKTRMDDLDKSIKEIQEELSRDALPTPVVVSKSPVQPPEGEDGIGSTPKGDDPILIHKCLEMIHCLLKDVHITALNPTLRTLLDEFILPNVKNINFAIRQSAVRALGLAGLRSLEDAKKYVVLLLRVAVMDM